VTYHRYVKSLEQQPSRAKASAIKRGIAGSLIWVNFDRHGLLNLVNAMRGTFIANSDDIRPQFRTDENAFLSQNAIFNSTLTRTGQFAGVAAAAPIDQLSGVRLDEVSGFKEEAKPWYSDQICPISCHVFVHRFVLTRCFAAESKSQPRAGEPPSGSVLRNRMVSRSKVAAGQQADVAGVSLHW
jgi:hypothetical protein